MFPIIKLHFLTKHQISVFQIVCARGGEGRSHELMLSRKVNQLGKKMQINEEDTLENNYIRPASSRIIVLTKCDETVIGSKWRKNNEGEKAAACLHPEPRQCKVGRKLC